MCTIIVYCLSTLFHCFCLFTRQRCFAGLQFNMQVYIVEDISPTSHLFCWCHPNKWLEVSCGSTICVPTQSTPLRVFVTSGSLHGVRLLKISFNCDSTQPFNDDLILYNTFFAENFLSRRKNKVTDPQKLYGCLVSDVPNLNTSYESEVLRVNRLVFKRDFQQSNSVKRTISHKYT